MSTPTASGRSSTWIGILLGLVILGLVAAFAIGLPKALGDESDEASAAELTLVLPDTLPGGYVASDDPAAFADGELAEQADEIAKQEQTNADYGNAALPEALDTAAVTRTYVAEATQAVFVQAFQSAGGAFAPNSIPDPDNTGGQATTEMVRVGDGACILSYGQQEATGQPATPAFSQCQVSDGEVTVQIGSSAVAAEELVGVADDLLKTLQKD